jgi:hypothetical protein
MPKTMISPGREQIALVDFCSRAEGFAQFRALSVS